MSKAKSRPCRHPETARVSFSEIVKQRFRKTKTITVVCCKKCSLRLSEAEVKALHA